ncbi:MAG: 30S ribosomal protein S4 [Candidatus Pacearchaeota archaeon]
MIRKHKKYNKPKKSFDIVRINEENNLIKKYGLKNKREIWKARAKLTSIRRKAKKLINQGENEQKAFIEKLNTNGFKVSDIVDVLALKEEDILKRRLQTIVHEMGISTTLKSARQMIVHKNIKINSKIVNVPSYMVSRNEEKAISKINKGNFNKNNENSSQNKFEINNK